MRRTELGFIFQAFNLIPSLNVLENVVLAAQYAGMSSDDARKAAKQTLEIMGLRDRDRHRPSELSGGQQQHIAIARTLVNSPRIIFGDEPTGNLDSADLARSLRQVNLETNTLFVLVTHSAEVANSCERTINMLDGRVLSEERVEERIPE